MGWSHSGILCRTMKNPMAHDPNHDFLGSCAIGFFIVRRELRGRFRR